MSNEFEYDVFLSYSFKDKGIVHPLAERLKQDGLRVWLDAWSIQPGDSIPLKIQHGLELSRTLLMCMSPAYFASDWGKLEHHTLLFRDPTNAQRRFIPLLIKDCSPPDIIAQFARIDWRNPSDEDYDRLLGVCSIDVKKSEPLERRKHADRTQIVLRGHTASVWGVAITPDGKTVVSGSRDNTVRVWDLATGQCRAILIGHKASVWGVAIVPDGEMVVSCSHDKTLKVWNLATSQCHATFTGHADAVLCVAVTPNGKKIVSGSKDSTLKVWDLESGYCLATLEGHTNDVLRVAITPDGKTAVSTSIDKTLRVWDLGTGKCRATFKGHGDSAWSVAITPDGKKVVSNSNDKTLKLWDLATGHCFATFEGHANLVWSVAITPDGTKFVSSSNDKTLKVWDMLTGRCLATLEGHTDRVRELAITPDNKNIVSGSHDGTMRVWDLPEPDAPVELADSTRYTNAKVVLVGETGVGKTGLALRLCEGRWEITESTHGMIISRLELPPAKGEADMEREVWLWDFAGQSDYRLIHQLYMDEAALGVLVFNPQDGNPFEEMAHWEKALCAATKYEPSKLLVAARCDRGGITISQKRFEEYVREHGFAGFLCTGAKTGEGCEELKEAIAKNIPWEHLPWTATSRLFKTLKDAILQLSDEKSPLVRLPELRQRLQLMLPEETITESDLRAVVGLMQGQGVVQMLAFGDFLLLSPAWINRYASVVVRMAREHADEMGVVLEQRVLDGLLAYKDMERLSEADEKILLRAIVQTFLDRSLCLRQETPQGTMLVFPSYFRRDKPDLPEHPNVFVTYGFSGPLEEIYATLVVRLSYSDGFKCEQLWKDAVDFKTPSGRRVGLAMRIKSEGAAEIVVYFEAGVPGDTKVTFIKYVHEHLLARAQPREEVTRVRTYVCPHCDEPLENRLAVQKRLEKGLKDIICPMCEKRVPLLDLIEEKFASSEFLQKVREMDELAGINLDNESRELILVGHAIATAAEAGQIFRPVTWADWGIDGEIEFKDADGKASGQRLYLQLKSGDSYLYQRKHDEAEVFTIKKARHAEYWLKQAYPVMLVIRTSDGRIRWMNVTEYLQEHGKSTKQIVFEGEPFTALNVVRRRDELLQS
jgi:WD40 repeat protein/transcription elongation factor Elf1